MSTKNIQLAALAFLFSLSLCAQNSVRGKLDKDEFEFTIYYSNDSVETTVSEMYDDEETGRPFLFNDCKRIYPGDTKALLVKNSDGQTFKAISDGKLWYFENSIGEKLSTYRTRPDLYNKGQLKTIYFRSSKNPSVFVPFSRKAALEAVQDNPVALKQMKSATFFMVFPKVLIVSGGVLMVPAIVFGPAVLPIGAGVSLAGALMTPIAPKAFYKSLNTYNGVSSN